MVSLGVVTLILDKLIFNLLSSSLTQIGLNSMCDEMDGSERDVQWYRMVWSEEQAVNTEIMKIIINLITYSNTDKLYVYVSGSAIIPNETTLGTLCGI